MEVCRAGIFLEITDPNALVKALEPDNMVVPEHVKVECIPEGGRAVACVIEVSGCRNPRRILTLRNTIDEILALAKTVEELIGQRENL